MKDDNSHAGGDEPSSSCQFQALKEFRSAGRGFWRDVSDSDWNDWHWQLKHRIRTKEELTQIIKLTPEEEKGIDKKTRKTIIEIDSKYFRPAEIDVLLGDSQKAKKDFGWESKIKFDELIKIMMQADLKKVNNKKVQ